VKDFERSSRPKTHTSFQNVEKMRVMFFHTRPVNQAYYVEIVTMLRATVHRKIPELGSNNLFLHHNNVPAHRAFSVKQRASEGRGNSWTGSPPPPYLPGLAPSKMELHVEWMTIS
jgi:hypothetical protein